MTWTRRELLHLSALTAAGTVIGRLPAVGSPQTAAPQPATPPASQPAAPPVTEFKDLRRNVGTFTGQGGTIGWLVSSAGVVIIDSQFPATAKICLDGINQKSNSRPIDAVINTHHHGDHTGGNGTFKPAAKKIVGHVNVPINQKTQAAAQKDAPVPVPPDTTFSDSYKVSVGDETIVARYFGPAHTSGDSIIHFEKANVAHMGDLMFNRRHAFIDRSTGGTAKGWITVLDRALKEYPDDTLFIFGHAGPKFPITGSKADLKLQRDYFEALLAFMQGEIKAGKAQAAIVEAHNGKTVLPGFPDHGPLPDRVLNAIYDEVSKG